MSAMRFTGACAALALLAMTGCAGGSGAGTVDRPVGAAIMPATSGEYVVVANIGSDSSPENGLLEFGLTGTTPLTQIPNRGAGYLFAGRSGDLYTVACCPNEKSKVAEYARGAAKPLRMLTGTGMSIAGVTDATGNVYLIDLSQQGALHVYSPASSTPRQTVKAGVYKPMQIVRNAANDHLIVLNGGQGSVTEFADGAASIVRKIPTPGALAIAIDSKRSLLYVSYFKSIEVYKQGATQPYRKIAFGKKTLDVYGLGVDSQGRLYAGSTICCGSAVVTAFAPGASTASWRKSVPSSFTSTGHCGGEPFAFDDLDDVYIVDCQGGLHYSGVVVEYSPAGTLLRTLSGQGNTAYAVAAVP